MKATATEIYADDRLLLARVTCDNAIVVYTVLQDEFRAILPYLQHAANCPPDRVRFVPEPMQWEHPTPWVWYSGEYTITLIDGRHYLIFRGECVRSYLSLADAQKAAERHREGK